MMTDHDLDGLERSSLGSCGARDVTRQTEAPNSCESKGTGGLRRDTQNPGDLTMFQQLGERGCCAHSV
eukprot:2676441-Alexandrium_andersonii.AAC.1